MNGPATTQALSKIALLGLPKVGPTRAIQISHTFDSLPEFKEFCADKFNIGGPSAELAWEKSLTILEKCERLDVTPIAYGDRSAYPDRLNFIKDPPAVLYVKGNSESIYERVLVAIVGTREPTQHGQKAAMALGTRAANDRIPVVSGLALGCDTFGHQGCVESQGTAIAVMAHGLDHIYPKANRGLAQEILETGGALVSEHPPGVRPTRWFFASRDRLQSALSDIVIVIETGLKGGTQHTIRAALEQRKVLACVTPVEPFLKHDKVQGTLKLLRAGQAQPVRESGHLSELVRKFLEGPTAAGLSSDDSALGDQNGSTDTQTRSDFVEQGKLL